MLHHLKETVIFCTDRLLHPILLNHQKLKIILRQKSEEKNCDIEWDHSDNLIHKFTVTGIEQVR